MMSPQGNNNNIPSSLVRSCLYHLSHESNQSVKCNGVEYCTTLSTDFGRFKLWAHGFRALPGDPEINWGAVNDPLDEVLERSKYLKQPTVLLLLSFATSLLTKHFEHVGNETSRTGIEHAIQKAINLYPQLQEDRCDVDSDQSKGSVIEEIHDIVDSLFELAPPLTEILENIRAHTRVDSHSSPITESYKSFIRDKFPNAREHLVLRFATGNTECHERLKTLAGHNSIPEPQIIIPTQLASPILVAPSEMASDAKQSSFKDSGLGSSRPSNPSEIGGGPIQPTSLLDTLNTPTPYLAPPLSVSGASESTICSLTSAPEKRTAIPPIPKATGPNTGFNCTFCYRPQQPMLNKRKWRKHLFSDLQPYMCTSSECDDIEVSFQSRGEWILHERLHKGFGGDGSYIGECPFCLKEITDKRKFYSHVGHHMEDIRLFALPLSHRASDDLQDFENSSGTDGVEASLSRNPGELSTIVEEVDSTIPASTSVLRDHLEAFNTPDKDKFLGSWLSTTEVTDTSGNLEGFENNPGTGDSEGDLSGNLGKFSTIVGGDSGIATSTHVLRDNLEAFNTASDNLEIFDNRSGTDDSEGALSTNPGEPAIMVEEDSAISTPTHVLRDHLETHNTPDKSKLLGNSPPTTEASETSDDVIHGVGEAVRIDQGVSAGLETPPYKNLDPNPTLALFRLIITGIRFYAERDRVVNEMRRYSVELRSFYREAEMEYFKFKKTCTLLLQGLVADSVPVPVLGLMEETACWDKDLQEGLNSRLGPDRDVFIEMIEELKSVLFSLQNIFMIDMDNTAELLDNRTLKKKLQKVTVVLFTAEHKQLLAGIAKLNSDLSVLVEQSRFYRSIKDTRPAKHYRYIRNHAQNLYEVLKQRLHDAPACACTASHSVGLLLEARFITSGTNLQFRVLSSVERQPVEEGFVQYNWREITFEALDSEGGPPNGGESNEAGNSSDQRAQTVPSNTPSPMERSREVLPKKNTTRPNAPSTESLVIPTIITANGSQENVIKPPVIPQISTAKIENLCLAIRQAKDGYPCPGVLIGGDNRQYRVWPTETPPSTSMSSELVSLESLLTQHRGIKKKDRLILGVQLASAVLQLHETGWMGENWGNKDILFIRWTTGGDSGGEVDISHILKKPFVRGNFLLSQVARKQAPLVENGGLFSLGVILIELWYGQCLGGFKDQAAAIVDTTSTLDYSTALELTNSIYDDAGEKYGDVVSRCIGGLDHRYSNLEQDDFKNEVYMKVFCPLVENLESFVNMPLDEIF